MDIVLCVVVLGLLVYVCSLPQKHIKSHWQHFFDNQAISTSEFYDRVRAALKARRIRINVTETEMKQTHVLSEKRLYLHIRHNEHNFFVCVAPYGTGTFASWWYCETEETLFNRIPFLSRLFGKDRKHKTLYQMDTGAMCMSAIHTTLMSVVDSYANTNGIRALSELERQYTEHYWK